MPNILIYKDSAEGTGPASLIERVNNMCGVTVSNPRQDLRGDFIVKDIQSAQVIAHAKGWAIIAVVSIQRDTPSMPVAEAGVVSADGEHEKMPLEELFMRPVMPGEKVR